MTVTAKEASDFCNLAQVAYRNGLNDIGHMLSGINAGCQIPEERFGNMMSLRCEWLAFGTIQGVKVK